MSDFINHVFIGSHVQVNKRFYYFLAVIVFSYLNSQ